MRIPSRISAVLIAIAVLLAQPAAAQSASDQIEGVIGGQIEAFMADDFATAFSFASPNIKRLFGSSERFGQMVQQGYPMVWRPADVTYLEAEVYGNAVLQQVLIRDSGGTFHTLEYEMIPGPDGWLINGVRIVPTPQVGA